LQAQITEEDITKKIDQLMKQIDELMKKMNQDKLGFKQIVKKWKRDKIVDTLIPLLHLENDKKITTEQEDFFKEIYISRRTSQKNKNSSSKGWQETHILVKPNNKFINRVISNYR